MASHKFNALSIIDAYCTCCFKIILWFMLLTSTSLITDGI
jgi:hypothetical protein